MNPEEKRLKEIEERLNEATPGPWKSNKDFYAGEHSFIDAPDLPHMAYIKKDPNKRYANSEFIAHSREDVEFLLDLIKQYKGKKC